MEWCMPPTLPLRSSQDAQRVLAWQRLRWRVEDWQRVLKSRGKVERLERRRRERSERVVTINAVIASYARERAGEPIPSVGEVAVTQIGRNANQPIEDSQVQRSFRLRDVLQARAKRGLPATSTSVCDRAVRSPQPC